MNNENELNPPNKKATPPFFEFKIQNSKFKNFDRGMRSAQAPSFYGGVPLTLLSSLMIKEVIVVTGWKQQQNINPLSLDLTKVRSIVFGLKSSMILCDRPS